MGVPGAPAAPESGEVLRSTSRVWSWGLRTLESSWSKVAFACWQVSASWLHQAP